jgi:hypothetical protein
LRLGSAPAREESAAGIGGRPGSNEPGAAAEEWGPGGRRGRRRGGGARARRRDGGGHLEAHAPARGENPWPLVGPRDQNGDRAR